MPITKSEPVCPRCDDKRMVDRIIGHNLEDGRRDLICCPKCLGAGPYKNTSMEQPEPLSLAGWSICDAHKTASSTGAPCPQCMLGKPAAPSLEQYQRATLAQAQKLGMVG